MHTHRVGDVAVRFPLAHHESQVKDDPSQHARSDLAEGLDINSPDERKGDCWVQFATNVPIVDDVPSRASRRQFSVLRILRLLDRERSDIDECREGVGDQNVHGQEGNVVLVDENPDREIRALDKGAGREDGHDEESGREACVKASAMDSLELSWETYH